MRGLTAPRRGVGVGVVVIAILVVAAWWVLGEGGAREPTQLPETIARRSAALPAASRGSAEVDETLRVERPEAAPAAVPDGPEPFGDHVGLRAALHAEACDGFSYTLVLDHSARRGVRRESIGCASPRSFDRLPPGEYTCTLVSEQGAVARRIVSLPEPGMTGEVVFDASQHCGLLVDVTDARGRPIAEARVLLRRITDSSGNVEASSDPAGHVAFAFLRPDGAYVVDVDAEGFVRRHVGPILFDRAEPRRLGVALDASVDVAFRVECEDAYARERAVVAVAARHYAESFHVDADGRGTATDVTPGRVTFAAAAPDHATTFVQLDVQPGAAADEVVLRLAPGRYATGRFVRPDGEPYTNDSMVATPLHDDVPLGHSLAAEADRDGRFEVGPFACDFVELTNSDFVDFREVVPVGVETEVVAPERRTESIAVFVETAGGAPRPPRVGVDVVCRGTRGGAHVERSVGLGRHEPDADGLVTVRWPRACATPDVVVEARGFAPAIATCRPEPASDGERLTARVVLQRSAQCDVVVFDARGDVVDDASAILLTDAAAVDAFDPAVSRVALDGGVSVATQFDADEHGTIAVPIVGDEHRSGRLVVSAPGHLPTRLDVATLGRSQVVRLTPVR